MRRMLHSATASAPGSLMLLGEHAVLHGHPALCAAVDQRIRVDLSPRTDGRLSVESELGTLEIPLDNPVPVPPFQFVLGAIAAFGPPRGLHLNIHADFRADIGFGSSAAVTVAVLAALHAATGEALDRPAIFRQALRVLHAVQGRGSGADLAAACFGGIVRYRNPPLEIEPILQQLPLRAHYAGHKTPTAEVIRILDSRWQGREKERAEIFMVMHRLCDEATAALRGGDLPRMARIMREHRDCQKTLGCEDPATAELLRQLDEQDGVLACKISGSGLGDCVIALGENSPPLPGYASWPLHISTDGVLTHA